MQFSEEKINVLSKEFFFFKLLVWKLKLFIQKDVELKIELIV